MSPASRGADSSTKGRDSSYVPPLRFRSLTTFYDATVRVTTREARWRPELVAQANVRAGHRFLDLGCGTGTLTILLKQAAPEAEVLGLDADAAALRIAREKVERDGLAIEFHQALIDEASFESASFDRVVSSLVFHHLAPPAKRRALARAREWLRPGGGLHLADWGRAGNVWHRVAFLGVQILDGFENTRDHVRTGLEPFLREAGFAEVEETVRQATPRGNIPLSGGAMNLSVTPWGYIFAGDRVNGAGPARVSRHWRRSPKGCMWVDFLEPTATG